ncbi:DUF1415 domain-containing protein [Marinobacterium jannaschii]|uniref:DUF1415 domain-containing protein n=1 Tax=Marinobacterium jannaschii TaxID=64970 RepID=UPI00048566C6|nr:DUF1415 domain-containing protein [Marinobacterium jannaschii]
MKQYSIDEVEALCRRWVETLVVGQNLCPFAAPVVKNATLRYAVCAETEPQQIAEGFLQELELIHQSGEDEIATTLFITPYALADFYDYLDMLALLEDLLKQSGLAGTFQLASFHPAYLFGGVPADDLSHWTNRMPFPCFHIIREGQMSRVLMNYPDPDAIPERNMELMRSLGRDGLIELFPPFADYC